MLARQIADRRMALRAVVCLRVGVAPGEATQVLQDFVKTRLWPCEYPRIVDQVYELPKTGTGKIDRHALASEG